MNNRFIALIFTLSTLIYSSDAHGFIAWPIPRGYKNDIQFNIDRLRSPSGMGALCRGLSPDAVSTSIQLDRGQKLTVQLALSIGAEHVSTVLAHYDKNERKEVVHLNYTINQETKRSRWHKILMDVAISHILRQIANLYAQIISLQIW